MLNYDSLYIVHDLFQELDEHDIKKSCVKK